MRQKVLVLLAVICVLPVFAHATITFDTTVTGVQQTNNNPCVVGDPSCKEPTGMTYNSQSGQPAGQGGTYDLFSPLYLATSPFSSYNGNHIPVSFTIGVDENIAKGAGDEQLVFFKTYDCGTSGNSCTLDTANSYIPGSPTNIPNANNGNGFSDFGLTGFQLIAGHYYKFEVSVSNDTDGMEEFFIIPTQPVVTPEPSSLVLLGSGLLGFAGLIRRKLLA